ncbi:hypothetical protein CYMTET_38737 [Cymbomonas tetramitiformis]|uniref:Uncharacterized protein n=1 Tax=Cymbomonas tetramitiformis TaxID=36881 RepID=A0AAE0CD68_9CHLO|nr:hypothetical protein CYMTET_38737 [Cymbomonas tetramitiformis]
MSLRAALIYIALSTLATTYHGVAAKEPGHLLLWLLVQNFVIYLGLSAKYLWFFSHIPTSRSISMLSRQRVTRGVSYQKHAGKAQEKFSDFGVLSRVILQQALLQLRIHLDGQALRHLPYVFILSSRNSSAFFLALWYSNRRWQAALGFSGCCCLCVGYLGTGQAGPAMHTLLMSGSLQLLGTLAGAPPKTVYQEDAVVEYLRVSAKWGMMVAACFAAIASCYAPCQSLGSWQGWGFCVFGGATGVFYMFMVATSPQAAVQMAQISAVAKVVASISAALWVGDEVLPVDLWGALGTLLTYVSAMLP